MAWEVAKGILIAVAILAALALILPSLLNALLPLLQRSRRSVLSCNQRRARRAAEPYIRSPGQPRKAIFIVAWIVFLLTIFGIPLVRGINNIFEWTQILVVVAIACFGGAELIAWMLEDK